MTVMVKVIMMVVKVNFGNDDVDGDNDIGDATHWYGDTEGGDDKHWRR